MERPEAARGRGARVGFWLGLVVFGGVLIFADFGPEVPLAPRMAAVALLMAVWWISDAIPLAATALLPIVLFPLLGIMTGGETAPVYVNSVIFLFAGGFMIALAMERWKLHTRIALRVLLLTGGSPARLVLGFMLASALLSMWISNTATAVMMLAIGLAICGELERAFGADASRRLTLSILLGIAYGASIGGIATLVGTPPNLSFARIFQIVFPEAQPISFGQWMLFAAPLAAVMLGLVWLVLTQVLFRVPGTLTLSTTVVRDEHRRLGTPTFAERSVLAVFIVTALLWVFRADLVLGGIIVPGWSRVMPDGFVDDGTVAIAMALLLFLIPSRATAPDAPRAILDLGAFARVPWHIIVLFGGGFALAKGFQTTGLSDFVGARFAGLEGTPVPVMVATVSVGLTFLTELTSNTATTEMVLPILASAGPAMGVHPLVLMIPATISASFAFMLPVATPPNAIIFGSGRLTVADMAKAGVVLNLLGVLVITLMFLTLGTAVFDIDPGTVPTWAVP